jgi:membrane protein insertase Oxa1/YidC/SpoIIIJ
MKTRMGNEKVQNIIKWAIRGFTIILIPLTGRLPSSILIYFVSSNLWTIFQGLIFNKTSVKNYFGIFIPDQTQNQNQNSPLDKIIDKFIPKKKEFIDPQKVLSQKQLSDLKKNINKNLIESTTKNKN